MVYSLHIVILFILFQERGVSFAKIFDSSDLFDRIVHCEYTTGRTAGRF